MHNQRDSGKKRSRAPRRPWSLRPWQACAVIVIAGLAAYGNSFQGVMIFDDRSAIVENPTIRRLWPPWAMFSPPDDGSAVQGRPLVNVTLALNYALAGPTGLQVEGYHAFNLAVHLSTALVLFGLVRRTLELPQFQGTIGTAATPLAFATALLWTVHPLATEAVNYLVQRSESLTALAYLLVLYCLLRGATSQRPRPWYVGAVCACAAGMATKEVMVSAPPIALVYDRVFLSGSWRECLSRRRLLYLGLFTAWALLAALVYWGGRFGAKAWLGIGMTSWEYAQTQFGYIVHYLRLCFWPTPLVIDYGPADVETPPSIWPEAAVVIAFVGGVSAALYYRPWLGFLGLAFCAVLAPSSSVVPLVREAAAERRMYLPLAAIITATVIGVWHAGRTFIARHRSDDVAVRRLIRASWLTLLIVAVVFGWCVRRRNLDYRSEVAIWADAAAKRPLNARAHNNVGTKLFDLGRYEEAITGYRQALALRPRYSEARVNLGNALIKAGKFDEGIAELEKVIHGEPVPESDPQERAVALFNLGNALLQLGRTEEAVRSFQQALTASPQFDLAHTNLAAVYLGLGKQEDAVRHFRAVVELHPERATAHSNLGLALVRSGRVHEAVRHYRRALELDSDEVTALNNLAWIMAVCPEDALRNGAQAVEFATQAVRHFDGRNVETQRTLAAALAESGRFEEAVRSAQDAINLALLQGNRPLLDVLRGEREIYQARQPYRDVQTTPTDKP